MIDVADFKNPPDRVKIHTWWHWMDGNITQEGITKDLEAMHEQGIVQATILNIGLFGERDFGVKKVNFNSPEWYEMFMWALKEANRLGIAIGAHNCDGWSTSGGPWITPEMSMKEYTWTKTILNAAQSGKIKLRKPLAVHDFYNDVAVVAIKGKNTLNSFQRATPLTLLNDNQNVDYIFDGCPVSAMKIDKGDKVTFRFNKTFTAEKITILPRRTFMWQNPADFTSTYRISSADDGINFNTISEFTVKGLNNVAQVSFDKTSAKFFRLELLETNNLDSWIPLTIGECELLPAYEKPLFTPEIVNFSEKAGDVKAANKEAYCNQVETSGTNELKEVIDLTSKMSSDGTLKWKPAEGEWTIIRFGYTTTGTVNAPATSAGTGLECDKMDTVALNLHFNSFAAKLIKKAGKFTGNTFKFILVDSWECGFQNWTANMMQKFENCRGYSLIPVIPVLCGESSGNRDADNAVLFDFRETIAELIEDNYYKHLSNLLHRNNMELHAEVIYGYTNYPALDILRTTQYVDLPMYEFWSATDDKQNLTYHPSAGIEVNMPAFAAIGYEKQVLGAEAYTGMSHYSETPADLKPFGDRAFCSGINQMILHSYVHQPNDKKPGMTLWQYGSHFNRNNTYWPYLSEWFTYQARVQNVLQNSVASHDVLYYLGDQLPQFFVNDKSNVIPFGYTFNACNHDILTNRIQVVDGKMLLNGKSAYSLLVLPPDPGLNFETLKRVQELVKEGVVLFAPRPQNMLSLHDIENHKNDFANLINKVWGKIDGQAVTSNAYGKGKVYWGISISDVLKTENILPEVSTQQNDSTNLLFIHKKAGECDVYFLMNQRNQTISREISFRVTEKTPEIWDPESGNVIKPAVYTMDKKYTMLPVNLQAYESLFFIFKNEKPVKYIKSVKQNGKQIFPAENPSNLQDLPTVIRDNNSFVCISKTEGEFELFSNQEKTYKLKSLAPKVFEISHFAGKITFEPSYTANIKPVEFKNLTWLTESENSEIKYFSGTASYSISFQFPVEKIQNSDSILLDLGEFESPAEIKLNGKKLGSVWKAGKCLSIKGILKAANMLEVSVANTFRNRFIGDFVQYGEVHNIWTSAPISNFLNSDYPLKPSGLKGPIRIINIHEQSIK